MVLKGVHFKASKEEIEDLINYYSRKAPKGIVHYKKFDDDIYYINKKKKEKEKRDASRDGRSSARESKPGDISNLTKTHSDVLKEESKKLEEEPISTKPSPNLPSDIRYTMRNTVIGRYPDNRKDKQRKVSVPEAILQDIIKATYLRNSYIEDFFKKFGKGRSYVISQDKLKDAFDSLGITLDSKTMNEVYQKFVADDKDLTATSIDISVEDSAKKSIEEIQKFLLELINKGLKETKDLDKKTIFNKDDANSKGFVSFKQFHDSIKEHVPKIQSMDAYFLAKRYCEKEDDMVNYHQLLDELDLIDRGINPLMTWAEELSEYIVKSVISKGLDFETLFKKFSPGKTFLDEASFVKSMQDVGVDQKFKLAKIKKFYYFIDDDKNQKVNFREMEGIVKTHCSKTTQVLTEEILENIKNQIDRSKKLKLKDIRKILDDYGRNELIDQKSFSRALLKDCKLRLDELDVDFIAQIYRDKKDKRSIKYTQFLDELRAKLGVDADMELDVDRRTLSKNKRSLEDSTLSKSMTRKDLITPSKGLDDDIAPLLRTLRVEAYDKRIDLKSEFIEKSLRKDGILTDSDFRKVIEYNDIDLSNDEIQKLIDKFINSVGLTIDTNVIIRKMYEETTENPDGKSGGQSFRKIVDPYILTKIAKKIDKKGLSQKLIRNLKRLDRENTNYLSEKSIKDAFHNSDFKLSSTQVKEMLAEIKQNKKDEYNYHHLL